MTSSPRNFIDNIDRGTGMSFNIEYNKAEKETAMSIKEVIEKSTGMSMTATSVNNMKQDTVMSAIFKDRGTSAFNNSGRTSLGNKSPNLLLELKEPNSISITPATRMSHKATGNIS